MEALLAEARLNKSLHRNLHRIGPRQVREWIHLRRRTPRGILFCPPLIGGSGLLAIRHLRQLAQSDYDLVSFNYAGHGYSTPPFSLQASLRDTHGLLDVVIRKSRERQLPLFGMGLCYGSIPLLNAASKTVSALSGIVLINALPRLFSFNLVRSFVAYCQHNRRQNGSRVSYKDMLGQYANRLLPNIDKTLSRFGALERRRISIGRTLWQAIARNPLNTVRLEQTPVLSIYSPNDPLLGAYRLFQDAQTYERDIRRICPRAAFLVLRGDHFLSNSDDRRLARQAMLHFLDQTGIGKDR